MAGLEPGTGVLISFIMPPHYATRRNPSSLILLFRAFSCFFVLFDAYSCSGVFTDRRPRVIGESESAGTPYRTPTEEDET